MVLNNFDGHYTFGAGAALGPGSKVRLQWRAIAADAWVTRFVGSLSELSTGTDANPIMITRWVGALYRFTSGNIPARLIINQTPESIMTVLCDAAGIPADDRDFDTLATLYNRQLDSGYGGVQQVQTMVGGFIYDGPDKVRLELPATRAGKAVVARYTDGDPTAAELGVPPPRRLTRPFGIINHVDGEYHYYTPMGAAEGVEITFADASRLQTMVYPAWAELSATVPLGFVPSGSPTVTDYSITFTPVDDRPPAFGVASLTISYPDTAGQFFYRRLVQQNEDHYAFRNIAMTVLGDTLCLTFEVRVWREPGGGGTITGTERQFNMRDTTGEVTGVIDQEIEVFPKSISNAESINLYGYRPRPSPLVIGIYQATPLADDFAPDYAELDAAMQADLDAYATPIPVFAVERACDTADHRADILARRLSDKVHLTADGPSMLGADLDAFVEAIQTNLAPTGEITQTLWIERAPPPVLPEQPSGFTVFRLDNMSLLLFWDNPGDADITGYRIWRGTSDSNINTEIESSVGSASTTQYTDDGLTNNQEYWYQIQALYGALESVRSDSASGIP